MNDDKNYLYLNDQGLAEISPTASRDARESFIDTYRQMQAENVARVGDATHALGSDLPAYQGGLHGASEYWKSRYQTPQTESRVANLRTAAQAQALNQLMSNDLAREQEKYSQAARAAQQRANKGNTTTTSGDDDGNKLNINTFTGDENQTVSVNPNTGVAGKIDYDPATNTTFLLNEDGSKTTLNNLTGAAEMRSAGWKLTQKFPNGADMTDGTTYTDPQTGFTYFVYNGRLYQLYG